MAPRRYLTPKTASRAIGLLQGGLTQRNVALRIGVSKTSIGNLATRHTETGQVTKRVGRGRKRKTTEAQDRFLRVTCSRKRLTSAPNLAKELQNASGVTISGQTVRRRLKEVGIKAYRPAIRIVLTQRHKQARMRFARDHLLWNENDWANVLFSDESRFPLHFTDGRLRVYRRKKERLIPENIVERNRYGGGSLMVWAGISDNERTELKIIANGTITGLRYRHEILQPLVRPHAERIGQHFILQQDNARPHIANISLTFLRENNIHVMEWPACSPDLNPIEHVWDMLQMAVSKRAHVPTNLRDLEQALREEWQRIP